MHYIFQLQMIDIVRKLLHVHHNMHTRDEFMLLWGCGLVCMDLSCSFTNRSPQGLYKVNGIAIQDQD